MVPVGVLAVGLVTARDQDGIVTISIGRIPDHGYGQVGMEPFIYPITQMGL